MRHAFSRTAVLAAGVYLLCEVGASIYPLFDRRTFSGLFAVMLAWPWIDYLPRWHFALVAAVALNALVIFAFVEMMSRVWARARKRVG